MKNRIIIAGSRTFNDYPYLCRVLDNTFSKMWTDEIMILSGHCPNGADALGERYAKSRGIELELFPAQWVTNGVFDPSAGFKRNEQMAKAADVLIVFWDGISKGTADMIRRAKLRRLMILKHLFVIEDSDIVNSRRLQF